MQIRLLQISQRQANRVSESGQPVWQRGGFLFNEAKYQLPRFARSQCFANKKAHDRGLFLWAITLPMEILLPRELSITQTGFRHKPETLVFWC
jgi:hypothetical protein